MHKINSHFVLSKRNTLGVYRGCTNKCIFCPSRSRLAGLKDFTNTGYKEDCFLLLETALRHKRKKCIIRTDVISDPYQKIEADKKFIRGCLKILRDREFGVDITTKNSLILRDLDLIEEINYLTKATVQINFMTIDDHLSSVLEPHAPVTSERIQLVKEISSRNIPLILQIRPILPFINDNPTGFKELLNTLIDLKPVAILCKGFGVRARNSTKEYFYKKLDQNFPGLKEEYIQRFGEAFILESPYAIQLNDLVESKTSKTNILTDYNEIEKFIRKYKNINNGKQLNFFSN